MPEVTPTIVKGSGKAPVNVKPSSEVETEIRETLGKLKSGEISSMSKEQSDLMKQNLAQSARSRGESTIKSLNRDLVRRGIYRSGIAGRNMREVRLRVEADISAGEREIEIKRLAAEFTDKMAWLDRSQKWLSDRHAYELGKEQIAAQREATSASYAVGMASVEAQRYSARLSAGAAGARLAFSKEQFKWQQQEAVINRKERGLQLTASVFNSYG